MGLESFKKNLPIKLGNFALERFFYRLIYSVLLSYIFFYLILGPTQFWRDEGSGLYRFYFFISNQLASFGIVAPEFFTSIICGMILLFFLNLLLIPFLGLSLPDYLSGVRIKRDGVDGTFVLTLKGYLSYYLDSFLFLLCPIGEKLTGLPLKFKKNRTFKTIILVLVLMSFLAPIIMLASFSDNIRLKTATIEADELSKNVNFENYLNYDSERFHFSAFSSLDNNRYLLIPSYDVLSYSRKNSYIAKMVFYDQLGKTTGELKSERNYNFRDLLSVFSRYNPLFSIYYPVLDSYHKTGEILNTDEYKKESESFYKEILQSKVSGLILSLFKWGPFVRNHIQAREYVLSYAGSNLFTEAEFVQIGDGHFFRMRSVYQAETLNLKDVLIPLYQDQINVPSMSFEASERGMNARDHLLKIFFSTAKWTSHTKSSLEDIPIEHYQPFMILDHFLKTDLSEKSRKNLDDYTSKYFFDLARMSLKKQDEILRQNVLQSLRRYLVIVRTRSEANPKNRDNLQNFYYYDGLEKALNSKNSSYFKL